MIWQDIALFGESLVFSLLMIPMLVSSHKPPLFTSIGMGLGLAMCSVIYMTLSLPATAAMAMIGAILWGWLAIQKARQ